MNGLIESVDIRPGVGADTRSNLNDPGRYAVTKQDADLGCFKTPTLRNLANRAPFMHDGSCATLTDAVRNYATTPKDPGLDEHFPKFSPKEGDVSDLVAFLLALTSEVG